MKITDVGWYRSRYGVIFAHNMGNDKWYVGCSVTAGGVPLEVRIPSYLDRDDVACVGDDQNMAVPYDEWDLMFDLTRGGQIRIYRCVGAPRKPALSGASYRAQLLVDGEFVLETPACATEQKALDFLLHQMSPREKKLLGIRAVNGLSE